MNVNCKASCGLCSEPCQDEQAACAGWAQGSQCTENPLYMNAHCPASCGVCAVTGCCFTVSFGSGNAPQNLQTRSSVSKSQCLTKGAQSTSLKVGWDTTCPQTAQQAAAQLYPTPPRTTGCCFSVGFGAGNVPENLQTKNGVTLQTCLTEGAESTNAPVGWSATCPTTPQQAASMMSSSR
eukprot:TRINITY_DN11044_c0_g1_i5.p1 TRINITY_DN11044_c0_g1~~TRINITY_DN11044_c0_g1_i5.p1  ORF type:complete len:180 (+),score=30.96 TRINITY_DN11044_c0_g1_i5:154-693(+)